MKTEKGYDNTANILKNVRAFNATSNKQYLWNCFEDLRHAVQSLLWRRMKGNPPPTFNDNVMVITEKWMLDIATRLEKGNPYKDTFSPISYAYFMIRRYLPTDDAVWNTRSNTTEEVVDSFMNKDYSIGAECDYSNDINDLYDYDTIL